MKKSIISIVLVVAVLTTCVVFADDIMHFDAYRSDVKIFCNNRYLSFSLPVVTINGSTYVPLREAAENGNMDVEWNGEEQKITITNNAQTDRAEEIQTDNAEEVFFNLFKFEMPFQSEILNYDYYVDQNQEQHFAAKIAFKKKYLSYVTGQFKGWIDVDTDRLSVYNREYAWWDLLNIEEAVETYYAVESGVSAKSVPVYVYITEGGNDWCYLYVNRFA